MGCTCKKTSFPPFWFWVGVVSKLLNKVLGVRDAFAAPQLNECPRLPLLLWINVIIQSAMCKGRHMTCVPRKMFLGASWAPSIFVRTLFCCLNVSHSVFTFISWLFLIIFFFVSFYSSLYLFCLIIISFSFFLYFVFFIFLSVFLLLALFVSLCLFLARSLSLSFSFFLPSLSIYLYLYLYIYIYIYLSLSLSFFLFLLSFFLSFFPPLSLSLSISLSLSLSIALSPPPASVRMFVSRSAYSSFCGAYLPLTMVERGALQI